jgi:hypothetical protein
MEKSNLRPYPQFGMMLCSYCEMLPASELTVKQQNPDQDTIYTVLPRLLGRLEMRVLQQDPDLPLRLPLHDKALALILQLAKTKMCSACNNINTCTCPTGPKPDSEWAEPDFWPYKEARTLCKEVQQYAERKQS